MEKGNDHTNDDQKFYGYTGVILRLCNLHRFYTLQVRKYISMKLIYEVLLQIPAVL